jgi:hypothetical protein
MKTKSTRKKVKKNSPKLHDIPKRLENELAINDIKPIDERFTRIKHFANLGDIIASLPACKRYWEVTGRRILYCQQINQQAAYYPGAVHPTVDENGINVCVNRVGYEMIKPLVEAQPYIAAMEDYSGQPIDLDFDVIRGRTFVGMPNLMLQSWIMYAFPDLAIDLSKQWLFLDGDCPEYILNQIKGKVIINFTERYRNDLIDYFFLKNYSPDLIFAGTEKEHWLFCNKWQLTIPRLEINNFLDYAHAIKNARFLLGNQSLGWNTAEALKTPRIIELCRYAPNCQPMIGDDSYGFFHQVGVEYYFRTMYNKTMENK